MPWSAPLSQSVIWCFIHSSPRLSSRTSTSKIRIPHPAHFDEPGVEEDKNFHHKGNVLAIQESTWRSSHRSTRRRGWGLDPGPGEADWESGSMEGSLRGRRIWALHSGLGQEDLDLHRALGQQDSESAPGPGAGGSGFCTQVRSSRL